MQDNEIISLFEIRDEHAIEAFCIITFLWQDHEKFKH